MVTKLSIALVEMDKMGKIGKMAIKMGEVSTVGLPIGVRIGGSTQPRSAAGGGKMGKISGVIGRTFGLVHGENSGEDEPPTTMVSEGVWRLVGGEDVLGCWERSSAPLRWPRARSWSTAPAGWCW